MRPPVRNYRDRGPNGTFEDFAAQRDRDRRALQAEIDNSGGTLMTDRTMTRLVPRPIKSMAKGPEASAEEALAATMRAKSAAASR